MAGLETVPCIVSDMDEKEQTSVMLLENIQRSDLTVYEQAQGFQMMLDLGETEDTIAEKTGFSKKTVRHRLNIAKLDSKTLMEKERQDGYQLSLTDLYELEKIKDVKTRDKILKDSTDSRDLARRAINAQKEQKRQENMKLYVAMMKKLGLKKAPKEADSEFYTDKWERMKDYSLDKEPPKTMKFEDNGEPMFYLERYGTLYVIRKKKKEKQALTPAQEAERQNKRNKKQIKGIAKKIAYLFVITVAIVIDYILAKTSGNLGYHLPSAMLSLLTTVWYLLNEALSITENAGRMGAPVPEWLMKYIAVLKDKIDSSNETNLKD